MFPVHMVIYYRATEPDAIFFLNLTHNNTGGKGQRSKVVI